MIVGECDTVNFMLEEAFNGSLSADEKQEYIDHIVLMHPYSVQAKFSWLIKYASEKARNLLSDESLGPKK